jgi:hypothetical protein
MMVVFVFMRDEVDGDEVEAGFGDDVEGGDGLPFGPLVRSVCFAAGIAGGAGYSVAAVLGACGVVLRWVAWCGNQDDGDEGPRAGECQNAKGCESMWTAL